MLSPAAIPAFSPWFGFLLTDGGEVRTSARAPSCDVECSRYRSTCTDGGNLGVGDGGERGVL